MNSKLKACHTVYSREYIITIIYLETSMKYRNMNIKEV